MSLTDDGLATEGSVERRLVEFRALVDQLAAHERQADQARTANDTIPVTVVTGPLGGGKTTLVRHLLQADHGLKLSVIVNDLAALNVDAELLASVADNRIELTNGCTCCSLVGELGAAVTSAAAAERQPDAIVIETSGISDPLAVCQAVDQLGACRLDGVITVVDAERVDELLAHATLGPSLRRQLAAATAIAVTKPDLVSVAAFDSAWATLAALSPGRPMLAVRDGAIDPAIALDGARHGVAVVVGDPGRAPTDHGVATRVVVPPDSWSIAHLAAWLDDPDRPPLLRAKGTFIADDGTQHTLQLVGRRWTIEPSASSNRHKNGIVLIGLEQVTVDAAATALTQLASSPLGPQRGRSAHSHRIRNR